MTRAISTPSRTKEILETYGLRARKNFGQNFLVDPVIVERCAKASHCEGAVIEIGPGHTLSGFVKKIDRSLKTVNIDTLEDFNKFMEA